MNKATMTKKWRVQLTMRMVSVGSSDVKVPAIGQGTWNMGIDKGMFNQEVDALRAGIEAGMTVIDTAEVYSSGESEKVVAEAIKDCRDDIFLVTKVWPTNGDYDGVMRAAEASLKRLGTDVIDLYLLHWPSETNPVSETMRAMSALIDKGTIRFVGVSNFNAELMQEAQDALGDHMLAANQVVCHLEERVIEREVYPYCVDNDITVMAYSPLGGQGGFPAEGTPGRKLLDELAEKYNASPYQVALAWNISRPNILAIPKSAHPERAQQNARALTLTLTGADLEALNAQFPVPDRDFQLVRH